MIIKKTSYERINLLVDKDSFHEIDSGLEGYDNKGNALKGDGVVTGWGYIENKKVCIYAQEAHIKGGTLGCKHGNKIVNLIEIAIRERCPLIGIHDSGGARIEEGVDALDSYGRIFLKNVEAAGKIPQICILAGNCAGGAAYAPALMDFIFSIKNETRMFITGPKIVKEITGQDVSSEELGGQNVHLSKTGIVHFGSDTEEEAYTKVRRLVKFLPTSCYENSGENYTYVEKNQTGIEDILPKSSRKVYDIKKVIEIITDSDSFIEVQKEYASNIVVGFAKVSDIKIGIVANQPYYLGGALDCLASKKAARFIRFCDSYNIPILTLVDTPGFLPGSSQEHNGVIREGAKLVFAYAESTIPQITIIIRKAFGGAYIAMGSKALGANQVYAWTDYQIGVMGAESALQILYKKDLQDLTMEDKKILIKKYQQELNTKPFVDGYIDNIISPQDTRKVIFETLKFFNRQYHGNFKHRNVNL